MAEQQKLSWWNSLPGILKALAGLVTAVAGLLLAYHGLNRETAVLEDNIDSVSVIDTSPIDTKPPLIDTTIYLTNDSTIELIIEELPIDVLPYIISVEPTCDDGIKNGLETGIDCGGGVCPPCMIKYRITTHTGSDQHAGTCEEILITLVGDQGTLRMHLDNIGFNDFQPNANDYFTITHSDIGNLIEFTISMNNGDFSCTGDVINRWLLSWIQIEELSTNRSTGVLNVNRWVGERNNEVLNFTQQSPFL